MNVQWGSFGVTGRSFGATVGILGAAPARPTWGNVHVNKAPFPPLPARPYRPGKNPTLSHNKTLPQPIDFTPMSMLGVDHTGRVQVLSLIRLNL